MAMNENSIVLYAICGDNERKEDLDRWFECASEADGAFIGFTGESTTSYLALKRAAADHGDNIKLAWKKFQPFRFDHARNWSIESAEHAFPDANIFFTIDMDEQLPKGWATLIKSRWIQGKHQRISYSHRHYQVEKPASRNWGHAKGWRWRYPCHEVMIRGYDGDIWYQNDECLNLDQNLEVVHYRNPGKPRSSYLNLLEIRFKEFDDTPSIAYLVREYQYASKWDEIISLNEDIRRLCVDCGTEACMSYTALGNAYEHKNRKKETEESYRKAVELGPTLRRGYIELGRFLIDNNRAKEGYEVLKAGLEKTEYNPHGLFIDGSDMWTWRYWDWLCVGAYWSGSYLEALEYALKALRADITNKHVIENVEASYRELKRRLDDGKLDG